MADQLSMTPNAIKKREYRARLRAEKAAQGLPAPRGVDDDLVTDDDLVIEVADELKTTPSPSLKERLFGALEFKKSSEEASSSKKPPARGRTTKKNELITQTLPLILSSFIATYTQDRFFKDPYKPCAPQQNELGGIFTPLCAILGRRVEITGKASQDALDLMTAIVGATLYSVRAYQTYMFIKQDQENQHEEEDHGRGPTPTARASEGAHTGARGDRPLQFTEARAEPDARNGGSAPEDGDGEGKERDAALVSDLFNRDKRGRVRLGLLPGGV